MIARTPPDQQFAAAMIKLGSNLARVDDAFTAMRTDGLALIDASDAPITLDDIAAEDAIRRYTWLGGHGCSQAVQSLKANGVILAKVKS
ncbi:hypothetical protein LPW26_03355 [Rhodopseudomonas sp. HC1]|uniref:hypothetical protein n=1 Tax=Rhodopseudomonas infernalis TaxID=2897386 RepID=UPI001EE84FC8|nr:hypothetical protein [Rhodopseudomonas infernalis]MCG6203663.1 hypothetical protein [Rhodopseudomonas infernalis]